MVPLVRRVPVAANAVRLSIASRCNVAPAASIHTPAILTAATPATPAPQRTTANTASDLRRIYREQQRLQEEQRELFPWEITQTKVTAWEPKYEDEKKFYYASKVQEDRLNLDGPTMKRYLGGLGSRYLLSKHTLPSGKELPSIEMTHPKQLHVELQMSANVLHYWYLNMQTGQRPTTTVKPRLEGRGKGKVPKVLKLNLSRTNTWKYLSLLHELWPRKDERDYSWRTLPRKEHGQYRIELQRVLAEGPTKPLNAATQSFIDHLEYQLTFHFKESARQNRNLNWLQFMGIPGVKITKKLGGEIKVPTLNAE